MDDKTKKKLLKRLEKINAANAQIEGRGAIIIGLPSVYPQSSRYLSGIPHLWSAFAERAFVFKNTKQAQAIVDTFALSARVFTRAL